MQCVMVHCKDGKNGICSLSQANEVFIHKNKVLRLASSMPADKTVHYLKCQIHTSSSNIHMGVRYLYHVQVCSFFLFVYRCTCVMIVINQPIKLSW